MWQRARVTLSGERLREAVDADTAEMAGKLRLPGFRPGKVSARAVRQRYGSRLYSETVTRLRAESFQQLADEMQWRLAHAPEMAWSHGADTDKLPPVGEDLCYEARFETVPDIGASDYAALSLSRPSVELSEADVDAHVERLRRRRAEWVDVDRPAAPGDRVLVSRSARRDGALVDGHSAEDQPILLDEDEGEDEGSGDSTGLVRRLHGLHAGETASGPLRLPDDYPVESLRGAELEVTMRVGKVQQMRLPELDDHFFAAFGVDEGGHAAFTEAVRAQMSRHLDKAVRAKIKHRMFSALDRMHAELRLPETQVRDELQALSAQQPAADPDALGALARSNVRIGLVVQDIARREAISAPPERLDAHLEDLAQDYSEPEQFLRRCRQDPDTMARVGSVVLQDYLIDWLLERATVSDELMDYDAVMRPDPAPGLDSAGDADTQTGEAGEAGEAAAPDAAAPDAAAPVAEEAVAASPAADPAPESPAAASEGPAPDGDATLAKAWKSVRRLFRGKRA